MSNLSLLSRGTENSTNSAYPAFVLSTLATAPAVLIIEFEQWSIDKDFAPAGLGGRCGGPRGLVASPTRCLARGVTLGEGFISALVRLDEQHRHV
jgi:hypothetical protein